MLDYALLDALAAVVRHGSFDRAAGALNVTPSAVSQRVKLLEERVGAVLVKRGQPCVATAAGALLVLTGIAFLTGFVTDASYWLLETFPVLGKIG